MKRFAPLLILFVALTAHAAIPTVQTIPPSSSSTPNGIGDAGDVVIGSVTTNGDTLVLNASGIRWSTVKVTTTTAGTAQITLEISVDGGVNWFSSAYAKRIDIANANQQVFAFVLATPAATSIYEVPLPFNATHFRARCGATGTTTSMTLSGGQLYVPGAVNMAVLYDVTEGSIGAGINTGTLPFDVSGWASLTFVLVSPTTNGIIVRPVDDTGALITGSTITMTAPGTTFMMLSRWGGNVVTVQPLGSGGLYTFGFASRRMAWYLPAGGTVSTGRIRVEASR